MLKGNVTKHFNLVKDNIDPSYAYHMLYYYIYKANINCLK